MTIKFSEELENKAQVSHVSYQTIYYMYILPINSKQTHTHTQKNREALA